MNVDEVIKLAAEKGRIVKPSQVDPEMCCVDCGPAADTNERARLTADGAFLIVSEGRYWQIGPVKNVTEWLKGLS
jgi:hypothetical protein